MLLSNLIIYCMATWRISSFLVNESGPFFIFKRFREWAGILHDGDHRPYMIPENFTAQVLSCVFCASVWVGLGMAVFFLIDQYWAIRFAVCLSFSTGAILIQSVISFLEARR